MRRALVTRALLLGPAVAALVGGAAWVALPAAPHRPRVVLITAGASSYWETLAEGARAAAREANIDLQVISPLSAASVHGQTAALASVNPTHVDGVVFCPADSMAHNSQINALAEKTLVMTCRSDAPGSNHVGHIGPGYYSSGSLCAGLVRELLPAGGKIAVLADHCQPRLGERLDGLKATLRIGIAAGEPAPWRIVCCRNDGCKAAELQELLAENPDLACILCFGPRQSEAAVKVLSAEDGRRIKLLAFDPDEATFAHLAAGRIDAVLAVDPFELGSRAVARMSVLLRGGWAQRPLAGVGADLVRPDIVTRDTLAAYRARHAAELELAANY